LLDDLLGITDPTIPSPNISADARRRRLATLVKTAALARDTSAVYLIEDAQWIDEASEAMLDDLATAVSHTRSMVVITYRPDYKRHLMTQPYRR
jgi:predicted ATPase